MIWQKNLTSPYEIGIENEQIFSKSLVGESATVVYLLYIFKYLQENYSKHLNILCLETALFLVKSFP